MNYLELIGFFGAFVTGIIIGLFGGGGSILAVPIFVYLFQLNPILATSYSMFVVGFSAAIGTLINIRKKIIEYKTAFIFTLPALASVFITRRFIIPNLPDNVATIGSFVITKEMALMLFFSLIIILSSVFMMKKPTTVDSKSDSKRKDLFFTNYWIGGWASHRFSRGWWRFYYSTSLSVICQIIN
ncbi:TSUP family transporter [Flavobacteriaceae bacterium]|nr:TSUP family transporter [Flavobacteriaceae bacterium]